MRSPESLPTPAATYIASSSNGGTPRIETLPKVCSLYASTKPTSSSPSAEDPIDTAKGIAVRQANEGPLSEYMGLHKIRQPGVPLIAVPTTAGTKRSHQSRSYYGHGSRRQNDDAECPLLPRAAIVDYELSLSMPRLTAAVGVDTLTHGIEAYVSKNGTR